MRLPQRSLLASALLAGLLAAGCVAAAPTARRLAAAGPPAAAPDTQSAWLIRHALALQTVAPAAPAEPGLRQLGRRVAPARLVALGEATHGTGDFTRFKHRLFRHLAEEHGYRLFLLEANLPECRDLDRWIQGGAGDPRRLLARLDEWIWNTGEMLELLEWMRAYNRDHPDDPVHFAGFDMKRPVAAMDAVVAAVRPADPGLAHELAALYREHREIPAMGIYPMPSQVRRLTVPAPGIGGATVRWSGWVRTAGGTRGEPRLWLSFPGAATAYSVPGRRDPGGWQEMFAVAEAPPDAGEVTVGLALTHDGVAWFDDLALTVGGRTIDLGFDPSFEGGEIGLPEAPLLFPQLQVSDYRTVVERGIARRGGSSLRIAFDERLDAAVAAARRATALLAARRVHLAAALGEAAVAVVERDARVVEQAMLWRAGRAHRDLDLAENARWQLERAHPGLRAVLSAANSHVGLYDGRMGAALEEWLGEDYVPVALTTLAGRYAAADRANVPAEHPLPPAPAESVEARLAALGPADLALDLRPARGGEPAAAWLLGPVPMRGVGSLAVERQFVPHEPARRFDLLVLLGTTSPPRLLGTAE
ncbi:MAG TPA: erythromycin esterase family protein [Thermoanaerobaculia bacterium]|nr:erythromycin esterase family protein [Thermoanaerobaculia bacterium]